MMKLILLKCNSSVVKFDHNFAVNYCFNPVTNVMLLVLGVHCGSLNSN